MITSDVENYPGYPGGVLGPEMMQDFRKQAERFGTEFLTDHVTRVDFSERPFRVWVGDDEYRAAAVIVATGASARQLGLQSERTLQGRGVSYCAVCDAAFLREKEVVVVGDGDKRPRRLRRGRRRRPRLPPGRHGRGHGCHGGAGRRALARGGRGPRGHRVDRPARGTGGSARGDGRGLAEPRVSLGAMAKKK